MAIDIGTVQTSEVTKNKDADDNSRMLQVEITNADDLQSIEQYCQVGEDNNPHPGARVIILDLGPSYRVAIAAHDGNPPAASSLGEKYLYSHDSNGTPLAYVYFRDDSTVEVNGTGDFAVRYNELKTAYDQLKADHDDLVNAVNAHTHNDSLGSPTTPPLLPAPWFPAGVQPSTGDMTSSKVDNVRLAEKV